MACMQLKGVIIRAHNNGLIPRNPFANFHMRPNIEERAYLTETELKELMTHKFDNDNLTFCRDVFVFASMTALSFVDIKELTTDQIVDLNGESLALKNVFFLFSVFQGKTLFLQYHMPLF